MRQFCQELIEHFRNLLIIRSVKKPEDILDLTAAELDELKRQSGNISALDIQRRLTLLIKAEAEMSYATFPRLIVEMALLKATLLSPVVPIQELIEKIKALETGSVHTPEFAWKAERTPAIAASHSAEPIHSAAPAARQVERSAALPISSPAPAAIGSSNWGRFVNFVNEKQPSTGSVLEHGSPLKEETGLIEVGFPAGSYYVTAGQDPDFISEVTVLAREFSGQETVIRVKAISVDSGTTPLSLAEKKKSDTEQHREELKREVENHPVVKEAARIFGSKITEVLEI
jgi:DNA polymerase-3 subunit gamma/tau